MKFIALFVMATAFSMTATASTITVEITGATKGVRVDEGPIFGYSSYKSIPDGTEFTLLYTFDDTKGTESLSALDKGIITRSEIDATASSSPGTNAVLHIGNALWEFGESTKSQVKLDTSTDIRGEEFVFLTPARGNHVSFHIVPGKGSYWPKNGDWRASFSTSLLTGSTGSFSADNDRVSAKGNLIPSTITVTGVNLVGQSLSYKTISGAADSTAWERQWQLAMVSLKGGYVVQQVTKTISGTKADGSPLPSSSVQYWEAWRVPAGSQIPIDAVDKFTTNAPTGATGIDHIDATARFYEGLTLPPSFAVGNYPDAGSTTLSSTKDPRLATEDATLPTVVSAALHF